MAAIRMSKARDIGALALFFGALGLGYKAFTAYRESQGQVDLITDQGAPAPRPPAPIDFSFLDGLFGGGGSNVIGNPIPSFEWPNPTGQGGLGGGFPSVPLPPAPPVQNGYSRDEITLARTLVGEAAPNNAQDAKAIASVIMNRVRSNRWPSSAHDVCLQPWQFSCWNFGDPQRNRIKDLMPGASNWFDACLGIARQAVAWQLPDYSGGADHYYADYIATPSWLRKSPNARRTTKVGVHNFYTGIA